MKKEEKNPGKELYHQLRRLSRTQLWNDEVPRFNRASPKERMDRVSVIRAVGVVFSESGSSEEKERIKQWLTTLLTDSCEKVRRYAITALPKLGTGLEDEKALLTLLKETTNDREKRFLGETLDKIGGLATLEMIQKGTRGLSPQTEQKVKASVARSQSVTSISMQRQLSNFTGLQIHLRGRAGLEPWMREEVESSPITRRKFRVIKVSPGLVALTPLASFSLGDLYTLRCFGSVGLVPGTVPSISVKDEIESLAAVMTSLLARQLFKTFTEGPIRYRLNFVDKGHQRGAVRLLANRAFLLCPELLNDSHTAPWAVDIHEDENGQSVEFRPRLSPDPRYYFRCQDIPAASHPPLAACLARWAGEFSNEIVWDPFCGSGSELIERALLGGVQTVHGTDLSSPAIAIARENFAAANVKGVLAKFHVCDFRDYERIARLTPGSISLILTNPPLGKRVPIPNLRELIEDLFKVADRMLKPGGRLIFANPLPVRPTQPTLKFQDGRVIDFGGFNCRLEKYEKQGQRR